MLRFVFGLDELELLLQRRHVVCELAVLAAQFADALVGFVRLEGPLLACGGRGRELLDGVELLLQSVQLLAVFIDKGLEFLDALGFRLVVRVRLHLALLIIECLDLGAQKLDFLRGQGLLALETSTSLCLLRIGCTACCCCSFELLDLGLQLSLLVL